MWTYVPTINGHYSGLVGYQVWNLITGCQLCYVFDFQMSQMMRASHSMTLTVKQDLKPQLWILLCLNKNSTQ